MFLQFDYIKGDIDAAINSSMGETKHFPSKSTVIIYGKEKEAVGFEPTISASISNPLPIELHIKLYQELEFNLIESRFFSISRRKSRKCPFFRIEMEKNRLMNNNLNYYVTSLHCG